MLRLIKIVTSNCTFKLLAHSLRLAHSLSPWSTTFWSYFLMKNQQGYCVEIVGSGGGSRSKQKATVNQIKRGLISTVHIRCFHLMLPCDSVILPLIRVTVHQGPSGADSSVVQSCQFDSTVTDTVVKLSIFLF